MLRGIRGNGFVLTLLCLALTGCIVIFPFALLIERPSGEMALALVLGILLVTSLGWWLCAAVFGALWKLSFACPIYPIHGHSCVCWQYALAVESSLLFPLSPMTSSSSTS